MYKSRVRDGIVFSKPAILSKPHLRLQCIYKMVVNDQYFYIGSSVHLRRRIDFWAQNIITKNVNQKILNIIQGVKSVRFEIVEVVKDEDKLLTTEKRHIKQHCKSEYSLNMTTDTVSIYSKPVTKFDLLGNKVDEYKSIGEATKKMGLKPNKLHPVLSGKTKSYKGFVYKFGVQPKRIKKEIPKFGEDLNESEFFWLKKVLHTFPLDKPHNLNFKYARRAGIKASALRYKLEKLAKYGYLNKVPESNKFKYSLTEKSKEIINNHKSYLFE